MVIPGPAPKTADETRDSSPGQLVIRQVTPEDIEAIATLHAKAFGPGRFARTAYRLRAGAPLLTPHCRAAFRDDQLVAAVRFTRVMVGARDDILFLGPLVVNPEYKSMRIGSQLLERALTEISEVGISAVVLVGDEPYYRRHGFHCVPHGHIRFPGPVDPDRILIRAFGQHDANAINGAIQKAA